MIISNNKFNNVDVEILNDSEGKERIRMLIDKDDNPK